MAFPARFAVVKSPPEAYEQRLKSSESYSEETISSLLERAAVDVEGSDVVIVDEGVQAAAAALDDFIYGKDSRKENEERPGETVDETVAKPDVDMENAGENTEKSDEKFEKPEGIEEKENAVDPDDNAEKPGGTAEKPDETPDEKPEDKAVTEANGGGEQQTLGGEDQEMKEATSADA